MEINSLVSKILEADKAYYTSGYSIMTDQEYDAIKDEVRRVDPDHPILAKVGHEPSALWSKARHNIAMGSLLKVHTEEEFRKWATKFPGETLVAQPKVDGLSSSIEYHIGMLLKGITRGDGVEGENITANIREMQGLVEDLEEPLSISVRAEIYLQQEVFEKINTILDEDQRYKNCRNAAAGISRRLDGKFCNYLILEPYDLAFKDKTKMNESEKIDFLKKIGYSPVDTTIGTVDDIVKRYYELKDQRKSFPFGMDGVVIKVDSWKIQEQMGFVDGRPRAQIAWKFDPPGAITTIMEESWDVGRTGVYTPLAHLEPVDIDGSTISKATLHNIAEIARLGIGRGDTVMVVKAGEIIPKIVSVIEHKGNPIQIPTHCQYCGTELKNNDTQLFCVFPACPRKNFQRILNFIKVAKIDGFGEALADKLFEMEKVQFIADIFTLKKEDIASIEGWGESSAETIMANIDKARVMEPAIFLTSMGIPSISEKTSAELLAHFGDIHKIRSAKVDDIASIKGFSTVSAEKIVSGMNDFGPQIHQVLEHIELQEITNGGKFAGNTFCFTGEMSKPRSFFQELVKRHGGKNLSSVTKDLSYLVCNEDKGSSKSQKATKYGVQIINEQTFLAMCGETIEVPAEKPTKPKIKYTSLFNQGNQ